LALANRVYSGQASSRITDYPNCAKPGTLGSSCPKISVEYLTVDNEHFTLATYRQKTKVELTLTTINSYNIRTGFHRNIFRKLKTVFNQLPFSAFFGFRKPVFAIPSLAHLFFAKRLAKNKKAKPCHFQKGVLSAQYCASHFRSVKGATPAAAWCLCFIVIN